jgi:hypothetical protein
MQERANLEADGPDRARTRCGVSGLRSSEALRRRRGIRAKSAREQSTLLQMRLLLTAHATRSVERQSLAAPQPSPNTRSPVMPKGQEKKKTSNKPKLTVKEKKAKKKEKK